MIPGGRLPTSRLELVPQVPDDADEMAALLDDERLHEFTGGQPATRDDLRARYRRLAVGGSADGSGIWYNWIVRRRAGGRAIGYLQATILLPARTAVIAWVIAAPWQGQGFASEAATALVQGLIGWDVANIEAHVHSDQAASAHVATHAGLAPTDETDAEGECIWRRGGSA